MYRLRFANGESKRNELFAELDEYCNKMEKLLDSSDRDAECVRKRAALKHTNAVDAAVCNFWPTASTLFHVLAASWNCFCQGGHLGQLRLQHRTTTELDFRIIFKSSASSSWVARSTRISGLSQDEQVTGRSMLESVPIRQASESRYQLSYAASGGPHRTSQVGLYVSFRYMSWLPKADLVADEHRSQQRSPRRPPHSQRRATRKS